MSGNRVRLLKRRALRFLEEAKRDLSEGYYDIGAFHVEQALQLYVKAVIFELFGKDYEGHGIRELISYLSKLLKENGYDELSRKINELVGEYRQQLVAIEDAYIDSRYEYIEYERDDLEPLIEVSESIIKFLEEVVKIVKLG
ncbi:HEPN domain-containing protein [Sulfurisphaera ohwakuensis]|uniref:HEPN domain-containing protein n=1 Tax=Sulfurisphaera ohwakuensis TaxID=69656 RepID=A0A650CG19_SULOH|nr:HEPN domain-containing protein [Sulfurisphaera ohwakuensis]MBB5255088.1 HEPN domain-containing protein [Sulfurisphaera ohwakuensis]QGR16487.1 HEPN domain-containing protein [Sulfurisphaera ohwakuensis]